MVYSWRDLYGRPTASIPPTRHAHGTRPPDASIRTMNGRTSRAGRPFSRTDGRRRWRWSSDGSGVAQESAEVEYDPAIRAHRHDGDGERSCFARLATLAAKRGIGNAAIAATLIASPCTARSEHDAAPSGPCRTSGPGPVAPGRFTGPPRLHVDPFALTQAARRPVRAS